jgi:hypothetical protein
MRKLIFFCFLLFSVSVSAQYYETGQDPASIKWRQINTDHFQLIYPDYFEEGAQTLAHKLDLVYDYGTYSLHHEPKKISIILHTQSITSNGLVTYAPRHSEFYTTPSQDTYAQNWLEQLATHEFRHVVQLDKINTEMPKLIRILLGEQGAALVFGAYLPYWFLEGDAVTTETTLSNYGRGRYSSFLIKHKAQLVEKGKYSYDKAYLGSYKDYVPNYYNLGYYMVACARERYGSEVWEKTVSRVAHKPFSINPFNKALKLETGMNKVKLYESIFDSLATVWKIEDAAFQPQKTKTLSPDPKSYTNYRYNYLLNDDEIISYKTSLDNIPSFVKIDKNGKEEKLFTPGYLFDESVSYCGEWVTWAEEISDLRWEHAGRSVIFLYNLKNKKKIRIFPDKTAVAPAISPDFNKVIVVENDYSGNNYLSTYNLNGKLISRYQTTENNYFLSPVWINKDEVACVVITENGEKIVCVDPSKNTQKILIDKNLGDIKQLRFSNGKLYFISSYSGKNALYAYAFKTGEIYQIFNPRFDAAYPTISNSGKIILSDYTANGYKLVELQEHKEKSLSLISEGKYALADAVAKQEKGVVNYQSIDTIKYQSDVYRKVTHLMNFHSWAPVFIDPYQYELEPGVSFMSQNKLGTAFTVLGYRWNSSDKTGQLYARYTYKGWFPIFDIELSSGKLKSSYIKYTQQINSNGNVVSIDTALINYKLNETVLGIDTRVPVTLSRGAYLSYLQPEIKYELMHYGKSISFDGNYDVLSSRLYYYLLKRQSSQDVYPNFGFITEGNYKFSLGKKSEMGDLFSGEVVLYLPGIIANHGIKIYGGIQQKTWGNLTRMSDVVSWPRGWGSTSTKNISSLKINYALPLVNPDLNILGLTYVKRINATLFYDIANIKGPSNYYFNQNISSYGVELLADLNFLHYYAPVEIGFRTSYLNENNDLSVGLLLSVNFGSL